MGPSRLSRLEIRAWEEDEHIRLERWERRALMRLDSVYLASLHTPETPPDDDDEEAA